jgi:TRAP-type C4-dicarboxylate transport system permease small subunit
MNNNLEAKLRKIALISGIALKLGVGYCALVGGCNLTQKEYADAAKYASLSFSFSIASYALLGCAGLSYGRVFLNYIKKRTKGP